LGNAKILADRSVTDVHLINRTTEEARLLKAERPQPTDLDPIPSLDQIIIWPEGNSSGRLIEPIDAVAKRALSQSTTETALVVPPSNDAVTAPKPKAATYSPVAAPMSYSISTNIRAEEPKPAPPTAIIRPEIPAAAIDPDRMISLRWVLRDISSNRLKWWPINQHDLQTLIETGFVEMRDGIPMLTHKGDRAID
jgi:hypothetical protein